MSGTASAATYTDNGSATATGGVGTGFAAKCSVTAGSVTALVITSHGSGYDSTTPPTISCPGGAGQIFTAKIASGLSLTVKRTGGLKKRYCTGSPTCVGSGSALVATAVGDGMGISVANAAYSASLTLTRAGVSDLYVAFAVAGGLQVGFGDVYVRVRERSFT